MKGRHQLLITYQDGRHFNKLLVKTLKIYIDARHDLGWVLVMLLRLLFIMSQVHIIKSAADCKLCFRIRSSTMNLYRETDKEVTVYICLEPMYRPFAAPGHLTDWVDGSIKFYVEIAKKLMEKLQHTDCIGLLNDSFYPYVSNQVLYAYLLHRYCGDVPPSIQLTFDPVFNRCIKAPLELYYKNKKILQ